MPKLKILNLTFLLTLTSSILAAQDSITISGQLLNNTRFVKVVVQKFGVGIFDIAAIGINKETGKFNATVPIESVEPGIYRFRYSQTGHGDYVDVIINGKEKDIAFTIDVGLDPQERSPMFISSKENQAWNAYLQKSNSLIYEIEVKQDFLIKYPNKKDKTYLSILKEFDKSKKAFLKERQNFIDATPFYWAKHKAMYSNNYFADINEHPRLQQFYAHEAFWINKPTTNALLINTPLYTDAILTYLQYFLDPKMDFGEEEQNQGFIKCVDTIMNRFVGNDKIQEFAIKYLQMGFKEIGNEKLLQYIDQKYAVAAQCTAKDDALTKRLKGYEAMRIGADAPFFEIKIDSGLTKSLKDFQNEEVILVFWASWCPHCMQEMPKLQEWAALNKSKKVIAVSLDEDTAAYETAKKSFPNLMHTCDQKKWDGFVVSNYFISATPSIVLIDANGKIKGKFSSINSFLTLNK